MKFSPHTRAAFATKPFALAVGLAGVLVAVGGTLWLRDRAQSAEEFAEQRVADEQRAVEVVGEAVAFAARENRSPTTPSVTARNTASPRPPEADVAVAPPVPEREIDTILGGGPIGYDARRRMLDRHVEGPITPEVEEALKSFILRTSPPEGLSQVQMDSLKSDALVAYRSRSTFAAGATDLMTDILDDPEQGVVMREFSLQHLRLHHDDVPAAEKAGIEKVLWEAAENAPEDEIAATALLSLEGLHEDGEFEPAETSRLAKLAISRLTEGEPQAMVSALQTLAELKDSAGLAPARSLLEGETRHSSTAVRLAAIYLLGQVAPESEADRLQTLVDTGDKYESRAAAEAISPRR